MKSTVTRFYPDWRLTACAAATLALAGPAAADLPSVALDQPAEMAIVADFEQISPEDIEATEQVFARLAEQAGAEDEWEEFDNEEYVQQWQQLHDAGLRGAAMIGTPADVANDEMPAFSLFVRHTPGADLEQLQQLLIESELGDDVPEMPQGEIELHALDDTWAYASGEGLHEPGDGQPTDFADLQDALDSAGDGAIRAAFVMSEAMREQIREQQEMMQQHAQQDPMAGMALGMSEAFEQFNRGTGNIQLGDNPSLELVMDFRNADAAAQFRDGIEEMIEMMSMFAAMAAADPELNINPQDLQDGFALFVPERVNRRVSLRIDEQFATDLIDSGIIDMMTHEPAGPPPGGPHGPPPGQQPGPPPGQQPAPGW